MVACIVLKTINAIIILYYYYKIYRSGQGNRGEVNMKSKLEVINRKKRHAQETDSLIPCFRRYSTLQLYNVVSFRRHATSLIASLLAGGRAIVTVVSTMM